MVLLNISRMTNTFCDQKYKFKLPAVIEGRKREMQMFYSPLVNHLIVRAI